MAENSQKYRLLVVDDDPNMTKLVSFNLLNDNFEITESNHAKKALIILESTSFDVIIIDVMMPEMDGQTLLKKIKNELKIEVPVIVLTAHGISDDLMSMIDDGAYDILQKPFTSNRLKLTLRNALNYKSVIDKYRYVIRILKRDKQEK